MRSSASHCPFKRWNIRCHFLLFDFTLWRDTISTLLRSEFRYTFLNSIGCCLADSKTERQKDRKLPRKTEKENRQLLERQQKWIEGLLSQKKIKRKNWKILNSKKMQKEIRRGLDRQTDNVIRTKIWDRVTTWNYDNTFICDMNSSKCRNFSQISWISSAFPPKLCYSKICCLHRLVFHNGSVFFTV